MNNDTHDIVDITGYTLSTDSHDELVALRDSLLAMARGTTAKGDAGPIVNMPRAQMGKIFEHIALQIRDIVALATPTDEVVEVPSDQR
jgi:hypothetical protein